MRDLLKKIAAQKKSSAGNFLLILFFFIEVEYCCACFEEIYVYICVILKSPVNYLYEKCFFNIRCISS